MLDTRKNPPALAAKAAAFCPAPKSMPPQDLPVWVRIPNLLPPDIKQTVWQKPIGATAELDLSPHLRVLLDRIASEPGQRGKVALVTSVENGVGRSTVARSLNLAAVNGGMLSVLIQAEADTAFARASKAAGKDRANGLRASKASLRSVNVLLSATRNGGLPTSDDIRSEFDLIVIDAPVAGRASRGGGAVCACRSGDPGGAGWRGSPCCDPQRRSIAGEIRRPPRSGLSSTRSARARHPLSLARRCWDWRVDRLPYGVPDRQPGVCR